MNDTRTDIHGRPIDISDLPGELAGQHQTCKGCGRRIRWAVSPTGARIPLVPLKTVYVLSELNGHRAQALKVQDGRQIWMSHFVDCPQRNLF